MTVITKEAKGTETFSKDFFQTYEEYIDGYRQYKFDKYIEGYKQYKYEKYVEGYKQYKYDKYIEGYKQYKMDKDQSYIKEKEFESGGKQLQSV